MYKITFLGPAGATFSHEAYDIMSKLFSAPHALTVGDSANYVPASTNGEILSLISEHGGYGSIAMETQAEGRVAEPVESFIDLLKIYENDRDCPFHVIGAVKLNIHFCLMTRMDVTKDLLTEILCHPKAYGACKKNVSNLGVHVRSVSSNGEAARLVSENEEFKYAAALGPRSAAQKYNLQILDESFEDEDAITTFFLIGPKSHEVTTSSQNQNRILIVFKIPHKPGSLVNILKIFEEENLNLIQIHSVHAGKQTYHFAIEIDVADNVDKATIAIEKFKSIAEKSLVFGPFGVFTK